MKLERLSSNKIKIFLTFDDLMDRGLTTDDIKGNSLKVHKLFYSMIEEACTEMDFEMIGSIGVEIFSLKAQGLIVIVTREEDEDLLDDTDSIFELDVRLADNFHIFYEFKDLEDVIQLCRLLKTFGLHSGSLYFYGKSYFLLLKDVSENLHETVISIASEYGCPTTMTLCRIVEYGKTIIDDSAIKTMTHYFK
ncbi:adapter protein MecA 1/2 [Peribacillus deserti]|uniref:Adapter protein MecA 1/2 n=1 Tax=Peribacillus deserti TaxID=673318 RepID=A0ABS2QNN9_9BACI|nr:adaptor protein MecA [Peribacillus deserti]MBM7694722.1 adapter protein MecA 1/2 [Peribacillus deserti]